MSVDDALRSASRLLQRETGSLLPYYALRAAVADVVRLPLLLGVLVAAFVLSAGGRLEPLVDELAGTNPALLRPDGSGGPPTELVGGLAEAVATPTVAGPLATGVVLAVAGAVFARGVTRAASFGALQAGFAGDAPLAGGVDGIGRWRTFAGLTLVRWGLLLVAGVPLLLALLGGVTALGGAGADPAALDREAAAAALAALAGGVVTAGFVVVVLCLLAFAGPAVVVENVGVGGAVRRSARVPVAHPGGFVFYVVVVVAGYLVLGVVALGLGVAGASRVAALGATFLLPPVLDSVAVGLYRGWVREENPTDTTRSAEAADGSERSARPDERDGESGRAGRRGVRSRLHSAFATGLRELGVFLRQDWGYVAVSAGVLAVGVAGGWRATAGSGVRIPTPADPALVFGSVPVGPFLTIAVNNWLVATTAGFSGLFAGLPTIGTLLFNGLLIGGVAGVVDPVAFVALVGPHGIVELPAIAVAGGVGLRLGHVAWGVWRGRRPKTALVAAVGRTWRLVVGLAVVFVVAGFVEAFLTPRVAAAVLSP